MRRRKFLDRIISYLAGLAFLPSGIFGRSNDYADQIILKAANAQQNLSYIKRFGRIYISLVEFAQKANFGSFTNQEKRKTVIYVAGNTIKFTADNGFVVFNDQLLQIVYEPFWKDGEVWAPAGILADLFNTYSAQTMHFDKDKKFFSIGRKDVNISQIKIEKKENGTLIRILTSAQFKENDIELKRVKDWLYAEIYKGKVDVKALSGKRASGLISEIRAVPFRNSVSLAFKIRGKIDSKDKSIDPQTGDILISLRTAAVKEEEQEQAQNDLEKQKQDWLIHTIIIDPGHGGKDPGAIGYRKLYEKDVVLPVALKLGRELKKRLPDVKIVYTRKTDVFIPLWKRTKIANENNGRLFVSLHCNWAYNKRAHGFETYFLSAEKDKSAREVVLKENSSVEFESSKDKARYEGVNFVLATMAQNTFIKYSQYLASTVQNSLKSRLRSLEMKSRGVKQGPFWVMVGATMPNILLEMGFLSNKYEAKLLRQKSTQTKLAGGIADGLVKYKKDIESAL